MSEPDLEAFVTPQHSPKLSDKELGELSDANSDDTGNTPSLAPNFIASCLWQWAVTTFEGDAGYVFNEMCDQLEFSDKLRKQIRRRSMPAMPLLRPILKKSTEEPLTPAARPRANTFSALSHSAVTAPLAELPVGDDLTLAEIAVQSTSAASTMLPQRNLVRTPADYGVQQPSYMLALMQYPETPARHPMRTAPPYQSRLQHQLPAPPVTANDSRADWSMLDDENASILWAVVDRNLIPAERLEPDQCQQMLSARQRAQRYGNYEAPPMMRSHQSEMHHASHHRANVEAGPSRPVRRQPQHQRRPIPDIGHAFTGDHGRYPHQSHRQADPRLRHAPSGQHYHHLAFDQQPHNAAPQATGYNGPNMQHSSSSGSSGNALRFPPGPSRQANTITADEAFHMLGSSSSNTRSCVDDLVPAPLQPRPPVEHPGPNYDAVRDERRRVKWEEDKTREQRATAAKQKADDDHHARLREMHDSLQRQKQAFDDQVEAQKLVMEDENRGRGAQGFYRKYKESLGLRTPAWWSSKRG